MAAGTTSGMTHRKTAASSAKRPAPPLAGRAGVPRRGRALPSLCLAGLPLGPSDPDRAQAEGAGVAGRCFGGQLADARERLDLRPAHGSTGDRLDGLAFLHQRYTRDDPHYSGRVTVPLLWDKQAQKIVNNESADIVRIFNSAFDAIGANALDFCRSRCAGDRTPQRTHLSCGQQRRVPCWLRHSPGRLRGGLRPVVRGAGLPGRLARRTPLPGRRIPDRGRYPPVHHPGALRCGVPRTLQVQPAAHRRLPESLRLVARAVPTPGHRRDSGLRTYQGALLRQPPHHQPDRDSTAGPASRPGARARPGTTSGKGIWGEG